MAAAQSDELNTGGWTQQDRKKEEEERRKESGKKEAPPSPRVHPYRIEAVGSHQLGVLGGDLSAQPPAKKRKEK